MMRTYVTKRNNVDLCCSDNADRLISGVQYDAVFSLRRNRLIIDFVKLLGGSRARFYAAQHKFGKLVRCIAELPRLVFIMFDAVFLGKFAPKLLCCHIFHLLFNAVNTLMPRSRPRFRSMHGGKNAQ